MNRGSSRNALLAACVVVTSVLSPGSFAASATGRVRPRRCDLQRTKVRGGIWTRYSVTFRAQQPSLLDRPDGLVDVVAGLPGGSVFATDGETIVRSNDSGCTWEEVYALPDRAGPDAPFSSVDTYVNSLTAATLRAGHYRVYAALSTRYESGQGPAGVVSTPGAYVLTSDDGGATWRRADAGIAPVAQFPVIRVDPRRPATLYLAAQVGVQAEGLKVEDAGPADLYRTLFYRSSDGGDTWELRSDLVTHASLDHRSAGGGSTAWFDFAVDPFRRDSVWAWDPAQIQVSHDGAGTWTNARGPFPAGGAYDVDFVRGARGPAVVAAPSAIPGDPHPPRYLAVSSDGRRWSTTCVPVVARWAVVSDRRSAKSLFVAAQSTSAVQVFRFDGRWNAPCSAGFDLSSDAWEDVSPRRDGGAFTSLRALSLPGGRPMLYGASTRPFAAQAFVGAAGRGGAR